MRTSQRHTLVVVSEDPECRFSLERAAELTGMHPEMILEFTRAEIVHTSGTDSDGSPRFDETEIVRLRQIEYLRAIEGASLRTIRNILALFDRLEAAEHELRLLRQQLR
jgi:DNA-binding transcriptional MerR regulator